MRSLSFSVVILIVIIVSSSFIIVPSSSAQLKTSKENSPPSTQEWFTDGTVCRFKKGMRRRTKRMSPVVVVGSCCRACAASGSARDRRAKGSLPRASRGKHSVRKLVLLFPQGCGHSRGPSLSPQKRAATPRAVRARRLGCLPLRMVSAVVAVAVLYVSSSPSRRGGARCRRCVVHKQLVVSASRGRCEIAAPSDVGGTRKVRGRPSPQA